MSSISSLPDSRDGWTDIADGLVVFSAFKLITIPLMAIFSGALWGPHAFTGGAIIVATVMFVEAFLLLHGKPGVGYDVL